MVEVDSSGLPRNRPEGTLMEHVGFFSQGRGVGEEVKRMDTGEIVAPWWGVCLVHRSRVAEIAYEFINM